jgi:hypothetical protein
LESNLQPTTLFIREAHSRLDQNRAEAPLSTSDAPVLERCHRGFDLAPLAVQELDPIGVVEELGRQGEPEAHDLRPRDSGLGLEADVDHSRGSSGQEKRRAREEKSAAIQRRLSERRTSDRG